MLRTHIFAYFDNIFDNKTRQIFVRIACRYTSNYVLSSCSMNLYVLRASLGACVCLRQHFAMRCSKFSTLNCYGFGLVGRDGKGLVGTVRFVRSVLQSHGPSLGFSTKT